MNDSTQKWQHVELLWSQFSQEDWGDATQYVDFRDWEIVGIQFKALDASFVFAVDNVSFVGGNPQDADDNADDDTDESEIDTDTGEAVSCDDLDESDGILKGLCTGSGNAGLIDNMEDGDYKISKADCRLGVWYTFNTGAGCQQTPLVDENNRFAMTSGGAKGSAFGASTRGNNCEAADWSGGGIGFAFLTSYSEIDDLATRCSDGYDASAYTGISFDLKNSQSLRVQVCIKDVTDSNCHGYDVAPNPSGFTTITVPWIQFLQEDWGAGTKLVDFDPSQLDSIQFKSSSATFDFTVDNITFTGAGNTGTGGGGSGTWHAYKPSALSKQSLLTEYQNWKSRHLVDCSDGSADVRKSGTEGVSEGIGYGMILAVAMDDPSTFKKLYKSFIKRKNPRGMMKWKFEVCGAVYTENAATDGDLDIAMGLIQADRKWGGYSTDATRLISAIKQYGTSLCSGMTILRPGDNWGGCQDTVDSRINPSYFSPGYYLAFASYVPNQKTFWQGMIDDSYVLLDKYQTKMNKLFPDWGYVDGNVSGSYWYDACRVPWRIATHYAWSGDSRALTILDKMYKYASNKGGPNAASPVANSAFIGGFALTATTVSQQKVDDWYAEWIPPYPNHPAARLATIPIIKEH